MGQLWGLNHVNKSKGLGMGRRGFSAHRALVDLGLFTHEAPLLFEEVTPVSGLEKKDCEGASGNLELLDFVLVWAAGPRCSWS